MKRIKADEIKKSSGSGSNCFSSLGGVQVTVAAASGWTLMRQLISIRSLMSKTKEEQTAPAVEVTR